MQIQFLLDINLSIGYSWLDGKPILVSNNSVFNFRERQGANPARPGHLVAPLPIVDVRVRVAFLTRMRMDMATRMSLIIKVSI